MNTNEPLPLPALTGPSWTLPGCPQQPLRVTVEDQPAWLIRSYREVTAVLGNHYHYPLGLSPQYADGTDYNGFRLPPELAEHLLALDGTQHARVRGLVAPSLSAHRLGELITALTRRTRRTLATLDPSQPVELVRALVAPVTIDLIGDLVGLPDEPQQALHTWAATMLGPTAAEVPRARDSLDAMTRLLHEVLTSPCPPPGMLADLRTAHHDGQCTQNELTSLVFYLTYVFFEVAVDAAAAVLLRLLTSSQARAVAADAQRRTHAIDEILRYDSPQLLAAPRLALADFTLGDQHIRAGQTVLASLAESNRDPAVFTEPHRLDLGRRPNPHLSLGRGTHACPAASLTRQLLDALIHCLFDEYPNLVLTEDDPPWRGNFRHHGPAAIEVDLRATRSTGHPVP